VASDALGGQDHAVVIVAGKPINGSRKVPVQPAKKEDVDHLSLPSRVARHLAVAGQSNQHIIGTTRGDALHIRERARRPSRINTSCG
jgi:hypothetical protein